MVETTNAGEWSEANSTQLDAFRRQLPTVH